jgi:hypothetical protein
MNMPRNAVHAAAVALLALSGAANAGVLFADSFDSENSGFGTLNYTGLANWTVSSGSVDLIGVGFIDLLPGNGLYLDLDGTTSDAALLTSNLINLPAGQYELSFDLAGSQRGDINTVHVSFLGETLDVTLASSVPFTRYTIPVSVGNAASGSIVFDHEGNDNFGLLLDNVEVRLVPSPGAAMAGVAMFGAVGARRRR